ncbi:MAG TPA: DUF4097 family beta strand repeat-containing protein, partial [Rhodothermales bacterium]|nr:DUF4097 family beta strand repeat-containing protein [Rhodothermales bacterium]
MAREKFQRFALVTLVVLVALVATQHRRWFPHLRVNHGDRCVIVERHVVTDGVALAPLPPLPPLPPMAPPPPPPPPPPPLPAPPAPPAFSSADAARFEADARRVAADARRQVAEARHHVANVRRQAEEAARQAERAHRDARGMTMMTVASRDEVVYERSFTFRNGDRLNVGLSSEDVRVEAGRAGQASVRVVGRGTGVREEFERRRFEAGTSGGTLRVRTNPQQSRLPRRTTASFSVVIVLPIEAQLEVATSSGDIWIARAEGRSASVTTSSGDISLGSLRADQISVTASSGGIEAESLDGAVEIA